MARCVTCGNDYERSLEVKLDGATYSFDCFECAVQKLAPRCKACGTRILGHGVQAGEDIFCCAHCARQDGVRGITSRVAEQPSA